MLARGLQQRWFQRRLVPALWFLLPLSAVFGVISAWRRRLIKPIRLPLPVVVVGNITVGGAGKTPLTLALVEALRQRGYRPGIISRGYGSTTDLPRPVTSTATAGEVGDEPLLLARRSGVPVFVGRDRVAAGQALLTAYPDINLILCDDGLQHYRLARDVELAVFDERGIGNGQLLPAGPLRERPSRLARVDAVIWNGVVDGSSTAKWPTRPQFVMQLRGEIFRRLGDPAQTCDAQALRGRALVAIAGIGHPERFFATLLALGLAVTPRAFPDHHAYTAADLQVPAGSVLLMTEKDAVKCAALTTGEAWYLPVEAALPPALIELIVEKLRGRPAA